MPHPRPSSRLAAAAALAALSALASTAPAAAQPSTRIGPLATVRHTIAVNPLALPLGALSAEYERVLGQTGFAFGVGGTASFVDNYSLTDADDRFSSLQAKLKYYPSESGLRGFAVGITFGLVHARGTDDSGVYFPPCTTSGCTSTTGSYTRGATAPTLGANVDYNWLIGRQRRFVVGLGVGARRVVASRADRSVLGDVIPDGRLVVGYGF